MGTRADFYIRASDALQWQGSVAWDGYDVEEMTEEAAANVRLATTEQEFRAALQVYFSHRTDVTVPAHGWPWPWKDSATTDRAYVFGRGKVTCYAWGKEIIDKDGEKKGPEPIGGWPNMTAVQNGLASIRRR